MKINVRVRFLGAIFTCFSTAAIACTPAPDAKFDLLQNSQLAVVMARVQSVDVVSMDGVKSCLQVDYSVIKPLLRTIPSEFQVQFCYDYLSSEQLSYLKSAKGFTSVSGYLAGAEVLLGVVKHGVGEADYRYAFLSCWGPMHIRVDTLHETQREDLMSDLKQQISQIGH